MDNASITWLGHATTRIELPNLTLLTDPAVTKRLAHLRRHHHVDPVQYRGVDVVLISHLHMDHLHLPSLRRIGKATPIIAPRGSGRLLAKRGFTHVIEIGRDEIVEMNGVNISAVYAEHSSERGPQYRGSADALGFVIDDAQQRIYFAGDTDYFDGMQTLKPIDIALIPIGGWANHLGHGHLNPQRAVDALDALDPKLVVPIHWGTYSPMRFKRSAPLWLDSPAQEFERVLKNTAYQSRLRILQPGESLEWKDQQSSL